MAITVISLISNDLFNIFFQMNGSIFTKVAKTFLIVDLIIDVFPASFVNAQYLSYYHYIIIASVQFY